ncbi:MAG TPA: aspartate/glutamate racemase family protein [bacterium]|nr:aspartate/glutamate racemase family protein [bacterium]
MSRAMRMIERISIAPGAEPTDVPVDITPGVEAYPDAEFVGGRHTYGEALGIIMMHKYKARIPGDLGNAETFEFPVRYEVVAEASGTRHRRADPTLLEPFVRAALRLQEAGVRGITTSCGFLAFYQDAIAKRVEIPVLTSSLLLIPMVHRMAGRRGHVGVITVEGNHLDDRYFEAVGAEDVPIVLAGMEDQPEFRRAVIDDGPGVNPRRMAREMVHVARAMLARVPDIHAFVLECTQMPPYAYAIQQVTDRPVYDITTLSRLVYHSVVRSPFPIRHWWVSRSPRTPQGATGPC